MNGKIRRNYLGGNHHLFELSNGLRVIHTRTKNLQMAYCGFLIGSGSRDEMPDENGIAHFIEHSVFKGTQKRRSFHILNRMESVGGELNAFTSRERTMFYCSSLKKYLDRAVEILTDIVFNPVFPVSEIEKEKSVISEEIEMYEDSAEDSVFDEFYKNLFPDNSLGMSILGTQESVSAFSRDMIMNFWKRNYCTENMVFSIAGNVSPEKTEKLIIRYLAEIQGSSAVKKRNIPHANEAFNKTKIKDFQQLHCVIGNRAFSYHDQRRYALILLNNLLGGDWMSSRLSLSVREKHAYAYNINSSFNAYSDCGTFAVQLGTDQKYLEKSIELILKEFRKLREKEIGNIHLNRSKRQVMSQYAMFHENPAAIMQFKGRNILDYGRIIRKDEYFDSIGKVTGRDIQEVAEEILDEKRLCRLIFKS